MDHENVNWSYQGLIDLLYQLEEREKKILEDRKKVELEFLLSKKQQEIDEKLERLPKQKGSPRLQKTLKHERTMFSPSKPLNPPTLCSTRLQEFIQHIYAMLKASLDGTMEKLQEEQEKQKVRENQYTSSYHLLYFRIISPPSSPPSPPPIINKLQEDVTDLIRDLRRLYQWIREEDKEVSQEASECLLWTLVSLFWLSVYLSEESHRGGFRNLLLDGWWLEFWEIILLAAGDVERNPGPRQITDEELAKVSDRPIEEDDLPEVLKAVLPASSKWSIVCCCLGLGPSLLEAIEKNHPGDVEGCLYDSLKCWIQRKYNTKKHGLPTWRQLVEAVDSGGNPALALKIATKHEKSDPLQATEECTESSVAVSNKVAIALDIAEVHKAVTTIGVVRPTSDLRRSRQMSSDFKSMYRSVVGLLRTNVEKVKDSLRYLTSPCRFNELCVPPKVYEDATTTKDLLNKLCPTYVNPQDTFVLEEIVKEFGSRHCKKELKDYMDKYI